MNETVSHKSKPISFQEARRIVSENLKISLESEPVETIDSLGRIASENVFSPIDNPPFSRATMDGYAIRSRDSSSAGEEFPSRLRISGEVFIGEDPTIYVEEGTAVKISTGCKIPQGADCVAIVERTRTSGNYVDILYNPASGENIAVKGGDVSRGELILASGTIIETPHISVLSTLGIGKLMVRRKLRIGIISTGNELIEPGTGYREGSIFDSNAGSIASVLQGYPNISAEILGIIPDKWETVEASVMSALSGRDILIISGGSSAGEHDYVYRIMGELEPGMFFHGVYVKPGMPTAFSRSGNSYVIGLPGFPVSALMVFISIFLQSILEVSGDRAVNMSRKLRIGNDLKLEEEKMNLLPVKVLGSGKSYYAYPVKGLSGSISRFLDTDGYAVIPGEIGSCKYGDEIDVILFRNLRSMDRPVIAGRVGKDSVELLRKNGINYTLTRMSSLDSLEAYRRGSVNGAIIDVDVEYMDILLNSEGVKGSKVLDISTCSVLQYSLGMDGSGSNSSVAREIVGDDFNPGEIITENRKILEIRAKLQACSAERLNLEKLPTGPENGFPGMVYTTLQEFRGLESRKILDYKKMLIWRG